MKRDVELLYHGLEQNMIYNALQRTLKPGYFFGPHCHSNVEICLMKEGECDIIVNGEAITVHKGELMVIFSHMIHSFHVKSDQPAVFLQIHFSPECFIATDQKVNESIKFLHYMTDGHSAYTFHSFTDQLLSCVERICEETNNETGVYHVPLANIYIYEMLFLLSREIEQSVRKVYSVDNPIAIRAIHFINQNMENNISLDDVAQNCNVTTRYLSKIFKKYVNITVKDYICIAKLDKAMNYICNTEFSITEISSKLGFSSAQYFSTVFKKYSGVTPKEFKNLRTKDI
ncbi:AraC-like DNA-binding protein/quercetin dioxygenase-like cupin family protein [Paenibacillus anaericanus]|uniref:helix-turn-helix transcriptional regulator n=1 Tax=Paenibacillus TaxID=44249 RepID=UPI0027818245|nr:AraC family transcriptional regulator [Paenibacillus anaericanus]MDQ0087895.1 AraC-like DNA-binding protein/quercetin dioxygenase-like cupin family protein [Paenibacillus anaericanus]